MDVISKCAIVAVLSTTISLLIKKSNPEFSAVIGIGATALILTLSSSLISSVKEIINCAVDMLGTSISLLQPLLKCMGISFVTKFSADLCRDASHSAAASALELSGAVCAFYVTAPMVISLLKMIGTMV